jgi:hypothetical protein
MVHLASMHASLALRRHALIMKKSIRLTAPLASVHASLALRRHALIMKKSIRLTARLASVARVSLAQEAPLTKKRSLPMAHLGRESQDPTLGGLRSRSKKQLPSLLRSQLPRASPIQPRRCNSQRGHRTPTSPLTLSRSPSHFHRPLHKAHLKETQAR